MSASSQQSGDEFDVLFERISDLSAKGYKRSAFRVAQEARRRARESHLIIPYLYANFYLMNNAQGLFDHQAGTQYAIETIALLESEEKAREIQPNLPLEQYEWVVHWLTACSYDNLAEHQAIHSGYGCEVLQGLPQEGMEICRRTGKLECIACFREYAINVFEAAGDIDMAMHFARSIHQALPLVETNDRRCVGGLAHAGELMLLGQLDKAIDLAESALSLAKTYHDHQEMRFLAQCRLGEILHLAGKFDEFEERTAALGEPVDWDPLPPAEENPSLNLTKAMFDSLGLACQGEYEEALRLLRYWDRELEKLEAFGRWFEVRTRLVATTWLSGKRELVEPLAGPLRQRARANQSWLYLQRIAALERGVVPASPVGFLRPPQMGPFASAGKATEAASEIPTAPSSSAAPAADSSSSSAQPAVDVSASQPSGDMTSVQASAGISSAQVSADMSSVQAEGREANRAAAEASEAAGHSGTAERSAERPPTPMEKRFEEWANRIANSASEVTMMAVLDEILAIEVASVEDAMDAARLIYVADQIGEILGRQFEVWSWAKVFLEKFPQNGDVLNLVATAALSALEAREQRRKEQEEAGIHRKKKPKRRPRKKVHRFLPRLRQLEEMFRKSLDLAPEHPRHYLRAARFFRFAHRPGETEWCLARSFALDRGNTMAALALADFYLENDRMEDAQAVLDICLREGGVEDPDLAWQAGLAAFRLTRYADALTYFNQADAWQCEDLWLPYYRAWTRLELGQIAEAIEDIRRFETGRGEESLGSHTLWAWAAAALGNSDEFRTRLEKALAIPLRKVEDLSPLGVEKNYRQLYHFARKILSPDDRDFVALEQRLYQAGLVPDELLEDERNHRPIIAGLNYYTCCIRQPLDEEWPTHPACREEQQKWHGYLAYWGVLAQTPELARRYVLEAQSRCYHLPAEILEVELEASGFQDRPGIVWQGVRISEDDYPFGLFDRPPKDPDRRDDDEGDDGFPGGNTDDEF